MGGKELKEKKLEKIKILLDDVDKEFKKLDHIHRAKFAIEQISSWRQKFEEAKSYL